MPLEPLRDSLSRGVGGGNNCLSTRANPASRLFGPMYFQAHQSHGEPPLLLAGGRTRTVVYEVGRGCMPSKVVHAVRGRVLQPPRDSVAIVVDCAHVDLVLSRSSPSHQRPPSEGPGS